MENDKKFLAHLSNTGGGGGHTCMEESRRINGIMDVEKLCNLNEKLISKVSSQLTMLKKS